MSRPSPMVHQASTPTLPTTPTTPSSPGSSSSSSSSPSSSPHVAPIPSPKPPNPLLPKRTTSLGTIDVEALHHQSSPHPVPHPLTAQEVVVRLLSELSLPPPSASKVFPFLHNIIPWDPSSPKYRGRLRLYHPPSSSSSSSSPSPPSTCPPPPPPSPCTLLVHVDKDLILRGSYPPEPLLHQDPSSRQWRWSLSLIASPKRTSRHFSLQPQILSRFADVLVYGGEGLTDSVRQVADRVLQAQSHCSLTWGVPQRKVYILTDDFKKVAILAPQLVLKGPQGLDPHPPLDFLERENREALEVAKAREILPNVWMGTSENVNGVFPGPGDSLDPCLKDSSSRTTKVTFDVCIHTLGRLKDADKANALVQAPDGTRSLPGKVYSPTGVIHLQAPASSQTHMADARAILDLCRCIVALAAEGHRTLIHSADGWLEPTIMILGVIMWRQRCGLAQACTLLWKRRAFYLGQLRRACESLEELVWMEMEEEAERKHEAQEADRLARQEGQDVQAQEGPPSSPIPTQLPINTPIPSRKETKIPSDDPFQECFPPQNPLIDSSSPCSSPFSPPSTPSSLSILTPKVRPYRWFYEAGFDDTFPSRILPFMYLGDLRQASDTEMLLDLGITHLLSVGITVPTRHRSIGVKVIEHVDDDGMHPLSPAIPECIRYIDRVHAQGGQVLVHCQVGTSRSASICIAYMMERVGMSLVDAYMWVRARRMAVIIQPNLLFMWELWERELTAIPTDQGHEAEVQEYGRRVKGRLGWLEWCRGITALNEQP
ncbi:MAG: hypothetical protein DHS80DRAFT_33937 [Piptocephalis tieghemiana]|nr:MAG: hypothetical protein DHS80DRAFT_33937 [Piptocephalis tieghemiana]